MDERIYKRNYKAMKPDKLMGCLQQLQGSYGDAYGRVLNRGCDVELHIAAALEACREKGMSVGGVTNAGGDEMRECAECFKIKAHAPDDFICRECRAA